MNAKMTAESPNDPGAEHVLLTVLGTRTQEAAYSMGGRQSVARLAPVALMDLLSPDERPYRVLAFCTNEAEARSLPVLEDALAPDVVESVHVPMGDCQDDIDSFLDAVARKVPEGAQLTVDMTHGFRHFAVLTYVAVLYVAALRDVRVRGAYYAMLSRDGDPSPFLNLRPLLDLPRWVHALKVIQETGSTRPLAKIVADRPDSAAGPAKDRIVQDFRNLADRYLSGLPLELGQEAADVRRKHAKSLRKALKQDHNLPLAEDVINHLDEMLGRFAFADRIQCGGWKKGVKLTRDELTRQAKVINNLLEQANVAAGLGLMREWIINLAAHSAGNADCWLDRKTRQRIASRLHAVRAIGQSDLADDHLTADQRELGQFWQRLCELRNAYHHHGMRPQVVGDKDFVGKLCKIREFWDGTLRFRPAIHLTLGNSPRCRIVVCPMGKLPGVLFSALHAYRKRFGDYPSLCIVICSDQTRPMMDEALATARYEGICEALTLDDPFGGIQEMEKKVKAMRRFFVGAERVAVNVTGGTTLMGITAQKLADEARRLACPVLQFGLVDCRPPEEQRLDPYQMGEAFWLDSKGERDVH